MNKKYEYIIIGQGLAGSALAWTLYFNNKSFIIIDSESDISASKAALGIYNPITGRKNIKTWNAEILFKELETFYKKVEKSLKTKILYEKDIYRPFNDNKDVNDWDTRLGNNKYKKYLKKIDKNGIITVGSGYLNVKKYLKDTKKYFQCLGRYKVDNIKNEDLLNKNNNIVIEGYNSEKIVMCRGINEKKINLFSEIPLTPERKGPSQVCGEIASVRVKPKGNMHIAQINCWSVKSPLNQIITNIVETNTAKLPSNVRK